MNEKNEVKILNEDRVQPHDIETEHAVLSTIMRYSESFNEYGDVLNEDLFYYEREKAMFRCIDGVKNDGGVTDVNSLYDYGQRNAVGYEINRELFLDILDVSSPRTLGQDIERIRDLSRRRKYWLFLQQTSQKVLDMTMNADEEISDTMKALAEIQAGSGNDSMIDFRAALEEVRKVVNDNRQGGRQSLQTGFKLFDEYYLLRPGTMSVIAAFTSVGKSALALNIGMHVAATGAPVAYYSLEMGNAELASRGISNEVEIPASVIMNRPLTQSQIDSFSKTAEKYAGLPLYFDDRCTTSFDRTIRSIRKMVMKKGVKLAIIDYLQIYSQVSEDVEESLSYMARSAKNIAKETGIAVIVLSQLNRSALHPSIKMLRGSGQIEESADNIVLIDRPEAYPDNKVTKYEGEFKDYSIKGTAKLILTKGRGVGTGCSLVNFDGQHTRFYERDEAPKEKYREQKDDLPF